MPVVILKRQITTMSGTAQEETRFDLSSIVSYTKTTNLYGIAKVEGTLISGNKFEADSSGYDPTTWGMFIYALEEYFGGYLQGSGVVYGQGVKPQQEIRDL